jgi:gamma-glutamylcyclotransferase (GGCT)/AIG2-like uncharacterized protein YtfP
MSDSSQLVFVYGTLRQGASNHFRMDGAARIASGRVTGRLVVVDWYPGLRLDPEGGAVLGEVYQVSAAQLAALDGFEGAEYRRVRVPVLTDSGEILHAWVWEWLGDLERCMAIPSGDWLRVAPNP